MRGVGYYSQEEDGWQSIIGFPRVGSCNNDVLQDFKIAILKQLGATAEQVQQQFG